ncbi:hypothetical protein UlMin_025854 [Ulmus minor]
MPPEPFPWDRKDCSRERKHERSESLGSVARWRDSSHHGSRELNRWSSADFRRPIGHGKQGGWHFFSEESGNVYASSRSSVKILEEESCHPSMSREGKYGRNSRENRGYYNQREWRGHSWEPSNGSPSTPGRAYDMSNEQKLHDSMPSFPSHSNYDFGNTWDQIQMKDHQHDKIGSSNGLGTGQKCDRENSLGFNDWKPMKWVRSASLSSRGSGLSHLSSSKSLGATDSNEMKIESQTKTTTPVQSPSGDAMACVTSAASSEDTASRKKPRLGWGEGLAKYEKKKVEVPDVTLNKDGALFATSSVEPLHSLSSNHVDKSPRVMGFSDCASPATPSSVACSSSPGVEDKSFEKATSSDNDVTNLCGSPVPVSHNHVGGFSFSLETLDCSLVANIGTSLAELLQSDDVNLTDTSFVRCTAMNKLLLLKGDISKALEVTESEIDSLETELKSLNSNTGASLFRLAVSSSLPMGENVKSSEEKGVVTNSIPRPAPLHIASPADTIVEKIPTCNGDQEEVGTSIKDEDVDSPGTVTSKFVEPLSLAKSVSSSYLLNHTARDSDPLKLTSTEVECSMPGPEVEKTGSSACGDCSMPLTEDENVARLSSNSSLCTDGEDMLWDSILASNKELANKACKVFNKLLPSQEHTVDIYEVGNTLSWQNVALVKEKLARRKRFSNFKERVITLKFKAFQHLWKEDTRLLSMRKYRAKSQKKFELISRTMHNGYQKHRSSIRSRFSSPAGNLSLVPTEEIINFTKKLLLDSQVKLYRDTLKMPALILDKKEKIASRFFSNNGLVEDPCAVEKERAMINPWMPEEKEIFMNKLATFGKDFRKISSFLDHKTTADCVEFYYKNHKSDSFEKTKKLDVGKQGKSFSTSTYLLTSGQRWNRERNAASLDILGEASIIAANADVRMRNRQGRMSLGGYSEAKASWGDDGTVERSCSLEAFGSERETAAADVLAGICGSLSSEAMSSCITSSVDPAEGYLEWKYQKVDSVARRPLTPDVTQHVDDETCSDESCGEMDPTDWTDEEKSIFIQAVSSYGRDFVKISQCVRTRSRDQCKVFFSKARKCLGLDLMHPLSGNERASLGDDTNGSGSGSENACALEMGSGISGDKSGSKMDGDLPSVINHEEPDHVETVNLNIQSAPSKSKERNDTEALDRKNVWTSDECQMGRCANLVSSGDNIVMNSADEKSEPLPIEETERTLDSAVTARVNVVEHGSSVAESVSVCEGTDPANKESASGMKPVEGTSDGLGNRIEVADEKRNASPTSQCGSQLTTHDSNLTMDASPLVADRNSCSGASQNPDFQQQVSHVLNSQERSCVISMHQETSLASANSVTQDSGAVPCEKSVNEDKMSSTLDCRDVSCHISVSRDESCEMVTGLPLISSIESSQVLRSYPLQVPARKEMNGDVRCRNLSEVQSLSKSESSSNQFMTQDCFLRKCNSSKPPSLSAELTPLSQKMEKTIDHPKVHSQNSSDSENSGRNGDVKLFGQILTTPSSLQRSSSGILENEDKEGTHQHKLSNRSSNIKFTNHHNSDGNSALLKFDRNNHLGLENVPMRNYPYWDGSRLQTAYPSVPDSAILLAKYPAAFSNFPTPSKMEQQPLQAVVKSNDRTVNGASVFPTREITNSNGVVDYHQVYRSRDATKVPPFTVDVKQRQDIYTEIPRRNGIEAMTSLQHQGRGMVGMNLVGRGGIIVSGPCNSGVSDPVAALKMHFAKTDQYGGQTTSMVREDESWRGNGDIGR